jgi:hypothetical protein
VRARTRHPGVDQRQRHVFGNAHALDEVKALEHETDGAVADRGQLGARQRARVGAVQQVAATAGLVEAPEDVHQRRLARPGLAHHGEEVAARDLQVDPEQDRGLDPAGKIALGDRADVDQRCAHWDWPGAASARVITLSPDLSPASTSV